MKDSCADVVASIILVGTTLLSMPAWSMDEMTDGQLASTTGQDGLTVTVALPSNTLNLDQIAVFNGFNGTGFTGQTGAGAFVFGKNSNGLASGAAPTQGNGASLTTNGPIRLVVDTSGGGASGATTGTAPLMNAALALPTVLTVVTGDVGIAAATGSAGNYQINNTSGNTTVGVGSIQIMSSLSMTMNLTGSPQITFQYGGPNQGAMVLFNSFNLSSIVFNNALSLTSPNGGVGSSQLSATPALTGLNLSGSTLDIVTAANLNTALGFSAGTLTAGGLLFRDASLSVTSMQLNNITAGTSGNLDTTFGGMANAPLGSFGISNMTVSNLKIGVSGM